jgi:pimeloyl-ACP methyl ester carboxylesterase
MPPRTQYTKSGNVSVAYQVLGDGPIDLVFAQGWLTNLEYAWENPDYARFLTRLAAFSRLIRFDRRGMGMSDRDVEQSTLEERVDDIRAVMDAAGSQRAALLGVSEGGYMSVMFAATHPERTAALVLYGCFARKSWA